MAVKQNGAAHSPSETTPLLPPKEPQKHGIPLLYRLLFCAFLVSLSFSVTQVPLVYVARVMTCEAFYDKHPHHPLPPGPDRCRISVIEAGTARAMALLGASTTFFGIMNLFVTSWSVKRFGVKNALLVQVFNPAVRLLIQNVGVEIGGNAGLWIIQASQIITIIGGPNGYLLALNTFVSDVVESRARTGSLGKLQGSMFCGQALGYLAGGFLSEYFQIITPFRVTLALFCGSTAYVFLSLPWLRPQQDAEVKAKAKPLGLARFFGPLKFFIPRKWVLPDGRVKREFGPLLLGMGAFFGVLATGYLPVLFQMYSTDVFNFGTRENSILVSLHAFLRGVFLVLIFPRIIKLGRRWLERRQQKHPGERDPEFPNTASQNHSAPITEDDDEAPTTDPMQIDTATALDNEQEPIKPPNLTSTAAEEKETYHFDLLFTKCSLLSDGILTALATLVGRGWQLYLVAALLPFASGTGAAAKGTMLQMCMASERVDALSAISLLENFARLSTTGLFGLIFAAFADVGKTHLVFTCNGAVSLIGFFVLLFARFPPDGSSRLEEDEHNETLESSRNGTL